MIIDPYHESKMQVSIFERAHTLRWKMLQYVTILSRKGFLQEGMTISNYLFSKEDLYWNLLQAIDRTIYLTMYCILILIKTFSFEHILVLKYFLSWKSHILREWIFRIFEHEFWCIFILSPDTNRNIWNSSVSKQFDAYLFTFSWYCY